MANKFEKMVEEKGRLPAWTSIGGYPLIYVDQYSRALVARNYI